MEQFEDHDTRPENSLFLLVDDPASPDSRHQVRRFPLVAVRARPEPGLDELLGSPR